MIRVILGKESCTNLRLINTNNYIAMGISVFQDSVRYCTITVNHGVH